MRHGNQCYIGGSSNSNIHVINLQKWEFPEVTNRRSSSISGSGEPSGKRAMCHVVRADEVSHILWGCLKYDVSAPLLNNLQELSIGFVKL
jgi:hypothetical protein